MKNLRAVCSIVFHFDFISQCNIIYIICLGRINQNICPSMTHVMSPSTFGIGWCMYKDDTSLHTSNTIIIIPTNTNILNTAHNNHLYHNKYHRITKQPDHTTTTITNTIQPSPPSSPHHTTINTTLHKHRNNIMMILHFTPRTPTPPHQTTLHILTPHHTTPYTLTLHTNTTYTYTTHQHNTPPHILTTHTNTTTQHHIH